MKEVYVVFDKTNGEYIGIYSTYEKARAIFDKLKALNKDEELRIYRERVE